MADEDNEQDSADDPQSPHRDSLRSRKRSARVANSSPFLLEAMGCRKKLAGLESDLSAVSSRIALMGGIIVPYEKLAPFACNTINLRRLCDPRSLKSRNWLHH